MDSQKRHYLDVMGIDVWEQRTPTGEQTPVPAEQVPAAKEPVVEVVQPVVEPEPTPSPVTVNCIASLDWPELEQKVSACTLCDQLVANRTQTVFGVGNRNADWLIIGEAPGADEDKQGEPFVGRAGQLLNAMLRGIGLQREQVYIANILKCRPPNNRDPQPDEAAACHAYLQRQIELIQPKLVMAVGRIAAQNLLHCDTPIGKLRGRVHQLENGLPLVVTYHPAYLLRSPLEKRKSWADLCLARRIVHELSEAAQ